MQIPEKIFRAYDIRGKVKDELTPALCFAIGRALGSSFISPGQTVLVGRDVRLHSQALAQSLQDGLCAQGVDVIDLGELTTPMLYFAAHQLKAAGAVMVTGSHNPVDENGLKIVVDGQSINSEQVQAIKSIVQNDAYNDEPQHATPRSYDIFEEYAEALLRCFKIHAFTRPIVLDAGNGVAGPSIIKLMQRLQIPHIALYCDPDGRFPNHHPDPGVSENMRDLARSVVQNQALFGLAFDGDGDRLGVVDENGHAIAPDRTLIFLARQTLKRNPGATIIGDVKCSQITYNEIARAGGKPLMWKTGHSLIKAKMRETGAALAGEMSGHFFFNAPWIGVDDAIYAALSLCEIANNEALSSHFADIPAAFATPETRLACPDEAKFAIVQDLKAYYRAHYPVCDLDGARIDFPNAWALLRASNTEAALVLRVEAQSDAACREVFSDFFAKCCEIAKNHGVLLHV